MATMLPDQFATRKKPMYPVGDALRAYLARYNRMFKLPVSYSRLTEWEEAMPLYDEKGEDSLWRSLIYRPELMKRLNKHLTGIYAMLKTEGDYSFVDHLYVDRIDYCTFGNSNPFRIRIVNAYNENQDYYYIKKADASRIYGLELEHLLSPNRMHYMVADDILVEEHIVGIPGDVFVERWMHDRHIKKVRLAKELVKFNERCFLRLLGDMRSYNFVVDVTPDFEETQVRIRAMDFDQQCYSGHKNFYLPQFFRENRPLAEFCMRQLNIPTASQYQKEEQSVVYRRINMASERVERIIQCMCGDRISTEAKVRQLRGSLAEHHKNKAFLACTRMGEVLRTSLEHLSENMKRQRSPLPALFDE